MLEWLILTLATWLGISPLAAIGLLVGASVAGSAALRWYRRTRQEENYYLDLVSTGSAFELPPTAQAAFEDPRRTESRLRRLGAQGMRRP